MREWAMPGVLVLLCVLSGCGGGKTPVTPAAPAADVDAAKAAETKLVDARATADNPELAAVKPPAPPSGGDGAASSAPGLTAIEREAIAARSNTPAAKAPVAAVAPVGGKDGAVPAGQQPGGLGAWVEWKGAVPPVPARGKKPEALMNLAKARREMKWKITRDSRSGEAVEVPPPGVFDLVKYKSSVGELAAYVSPDPKDGVKRPAIVWITGGDSNTIGNVWDDIDLKNEQSATAYRKAGIVMMFPSLRGGNQNPGRHEGFLNEVEDVIAAGEYLSRLPHVDPKRVYLGGHSSGGTMALLTAESTNLFRATFSFGPVGSILGYGKDSEELPLPFDHTNKVAVGIRSPIAWLNCVERPTFVIEGSDGNIGQLKAMQRQNQNPLVTMLEVKGGDHFDILHPINTLIAEKIRKDKTPETNITLTEAELQAAMKRKLGMDE